MNKKSCKIKNISIIGAGNLSTRLSIILRKKKYNIIQVYSRTRKSAEKLSNLIKCENITDLKKLSNEVDLYIICVKDDIINSLVKKIENKNIPIVHTSGNTDINELKDFNTRGVFYPLQSFNKKIDVSFEEIPICLESNNENFLQEITVMAKKISNSVQELNSQQRKFLHLAAVFASNFTNHMVSISESILIENNIDSKIIKPLLFYTINKLYNHQAVICQTGPAIRNDKKVLKEHMKLLEKKPEIQKIYLEISKSIYNYENKEL